jgi:hypothetical protein
VKDGALQVTELSGENLRKSLLLIEMAQVPTLDLGSLAVGAGYCGANAVPGVLQATAGVVTIHHCGGDLLSCSKDRGHLHGEFAPAVPPQIGVHLLKQGAALLIRAEPSFESAQGGASVNGGRFDVPAIVGDD